MTIPEAYGDFELPKRSMGPVAVSDLVTTIRRRGVGAPLRIAIVGTLSPPRFLQDAASVDVERDMITWIAVGDAPTPLPIAQWASADDRRLIRGSVYDVMYFAGRDQSEREVLRALAPFANAVLVDARGDDGVRAALLNEVAGQPIPFFQLIDETGHCSPVFVDAEVDVWEYIKAVEKCYDDRGQCQTPGCPAAIATNAIDRFLRRSHNGSTWRRPVTRLSLR